MALEALEQGGGWEDYREAQLFLPPEPPERFATPHGCTAARSGFSLTAPWRSAKLTLPPARLTLPFARSSLHCHTSTLAHALVRRPRRIPVTGLFGALAVALLVSRAARGD